MTSQPAQWDFANELKRFGPEANHSALSYAEALEYCRWTANTHYENFPVLTWFVPRELRPHFATIYSYSRWSDDLADEVQNPQQALELLDWWQAELDRCFDGSARHPVMVALQVTVGQFQIPKTPFVDLLTAFRRDQTQTRYETYTDLLDYCRCSANPVGRLVLYLARRHKSELLPMSDGICTGLQLANFWQDVSVDAKKGRIYLPKEDLSRFAVEESEVLRGEFSSRFRDLMEFQVTRAESLLKEGAPLARHMPGRLKLVISLFAHGGLGILRAIRQQRFNVLERRPKLKKTSYIGITSRALCSAVGLT